MIKRAIILFLRCLAVAAIVMPLPSYAAPHIAQGGTLTYSFMSNVGPLNPHLYSPNQMFAQEMVYEGLVDLGENGTILRLLRHAGRFRRTAWNIVSTCGRGS